LEEDPQRLQDILDGMGTGTARIIIDREASQRISEDFNLIRKKKAEKLLQKALQNGGKDNITIIVIHI
jgi:serine/threonine protein phosphatase PrpC